MLLAVFVGVDAQAVSIQALRAAGSAARMKCPPIPSTRSMPLGCHHSAGTALRTLCIALPLASSSTSLSR